MNLGIPLRPGVVGNLFYGVWVLLWLGATVGAQEITWRVPQDGGTPRDTNRIVSLGPREFRVLASFEEGGVSALRHAVSRVDLVCRNSGTNTVSVTLHLDLSDDGRRTDYDSRPESGMKLRDFAFTQSPGAAWRQVEGRTEGWVATLSFDADPGDTLFGLSPWYTYADYRSFVAGLPEHPHLERRLVGRSDGGREHWELVITDPSVPAEAKRRIFWHAREHAYETYSSYAMEGLIPFLLSEEAAAFRRRYVLAVQPMTNVDGVAQGYEYRGGYDFPDPRGTATGRLTLESLDRWRPDVAVAWHNWVAPRDRNVVFYTDGEEGRATARAWWRFTQLFPSLHGSGHRWKDEASPLRYNWEGKRPLSEANAHQYTMKKHGTRVWGWEMPWWNQSVAAVRASGADFARALLTTLDEIQSGSVAVPRERPHVEVPRWAMHEFQVSGRSRVANPFRDAALVGEFVAPSGRTNVLDGFHDGGEVWRLRFAPDEEGEWSYLLRGEGVEILERGRLRCTPPVGRGAIRVHPEHPHAFAYADGSPFFPMGDTCYGLLDDSPITPALREEYLRVRREQGFNFVRLTLGHSEERAAREPDYWAWGGTPREPDLERFNPRFFARFDALIQQMRGVGMNVELILLNFYRRPFTDPREWTPERERLWLRQVVARYSAFDNVFLWTIANEYETHPDGRYRLDYPGDVDWAKATARFIKEHDPRQHPVTVHPVISASRRGDSPRSPFDPPWRIGEFFGDDPALGVISQQTGQSGAGTTWDAAQECWTGDAVDLVASVRADGRYRKPVLNTEFGYEYWRGHPTGRQQVHHTDKVRRSAWRIVCAGGYFAAGFQGTLGHSDVWNRIDAPNRYEFSVKGEGAAEQLKFLYEFFVALPYWRLRPWEGVEGQGLGLADPGAVYVMYLPQGGSVVADLRETSGAFTGRWFNPRTGEVARSMMVAGGGREALTAPDALDWVLELRRP
ncbi:MAG: DUF4038 domain-containing protein [Verrucomicrobiales bacterium]|nr:DUF4038 domain-containing protein [Verrucomicrobiales bacterium]